VRYFVFATAKLAFFWHFTKLIVAFAVFYG